MTIARFALAALAALFSGGCFELDGFFLNGRHCSTVEGPDADLCTERKLCTPCDENYPFAELGIPPELVTRTPIDVGGAENDAYLIASDGRRPDVTLVYAHGNFGGLEHYLNRVVLAWQTGVQVFAIDYRGFGKSTDPAEPTEAQFMADAVTMRSALDGLLAAQGAPGRVVLFGFSAGATATVEMARTSDNCGLLLENPTPSIQQFADDSTQIGVPQSFLTTGGWDNVSKMPEVTEPLLQINGELDDFVRSEGSKKIFAAANEPKELLVIEGAGHGNFGNDVPTVMGPAYVETLAAFIDERCRDL